MQNRTTKVLMFSEEDQGEINEYLKTNEGEITAMTWIPERNILVAAVIANHPEKPNTEVNANEPTI